MVIAPLVEAPWTRMRVCQKCGNKQVTAIDKDLPLKEIVQIIKRYFNTNH